MIIFVCYYKTYFDISEFIFLMSTFDLKSNCNMCPLLKVIINSLSMSKSPLFLFYSIGFWSMDRKNKLFFACYSFYIYYEDLLSVKMAWSLIVLKAHIIFSSSTNNFSISGRTSFISIDFIFKKFESRLIPEEMFSIFVLSFLFIFCLILIISFPFLK